MVSVPPALVLGEHRVAGVDGEVDDHLLELAGIGADGAEIAAVLDLELDLLAEQALQEVETSEMTSGSWSTCGRSVCWREKASSWRVRLAARFELERICWMSS
jgi:hypothetical protein